MRALNAEEDLRTLGPQSAPLLSSGEVHVQSPPHTSSTLQISRGAEPQDYLAAHTHTRPQAPASGTGSDGAGYNNSPQGRVRRERQEKVWIGDSYDAELDIDLANLEPMPVLSKQEIRNRLKGNSTEHDQHADTSDYASLSATHRDIERKRQERDLKPTYVTVQSKERGVVPPERGSKRMRKIRKYLDPEEAFFNPDLAYKKAKKKADKAATRWKNRGISWAQINANLPPGVEPGPRKPKGWDRKEPPKAMKSEWEPTKRLSRPAMEKVRKLREENRSTWTTVALADRFKVSPEAIHRILRSKWQPSAEQYQRQMTRTFADYELHRQTRHRIAETDHE
ncbi:hypothetical protein SARC_08853 [Sphaeroforma arctica JP610]|uniref:Required for respiratory growth protein 9, mitochondrial n=1 Tax=Sphaeroforma arctica JP610 TaxID=667725 RepID=A0A0L0FPI8_9EUKA|nr:hypothetical protein SARC_08853 [Sphaeroforma arctica JP610]KNC78730.1 hypothetical protein SARC_08853 [Sphaeroforma arctica JP610]|eukprot:XP_014152632.1 hypothetical protein SARC_08853 [Sphaeroforma arctica JP610]